MTEEEARGWLTVRGWLDGEAGAKLERLAALLVAENERQNLVSASSIPQMWSRHIVDSAQLLTLAEERQAGDGLWVDLGSGAGFPGLVIACLRQAPIVLVETRGLRVRYLESCIAALDLPHASVKQAKVERVGLNRRASIISARAFAALDSTFAMASHLCDGKTLWLLPKGRSAQLELESASQQWQAAFHVEQSVTDVDSAIVVATDVRRRNMSGAGKSARGRKP
ncbi:16S rRNA (guanine(527)-N(7))-methyltransferase RsmG [Sphingobium sufflavum]|uniref:16S rRNA (guanine(527)-N(7))-methyltransferase RsmG n=1 Tax=Sphingobium sufflavum TaxID=1129547 RepID=UPI001F46B4F4|nr:16S rRNA (guanine(527)-N(7))-methyltransferase RsmG [Sphingobium sufflavum]MCE7795082.1 16S rRNA (guanine(527)-N(7))-methyltransferase RsmG [Sphingobium sufflavum]